VATRSVSRDIVVVGASAGGLEPLRRLVSHLPADLPAAIFIVLHVAATGKSVLPEILSRAGPLPAVHAEHGETIQHGRIYVAPPDQHLLLEDGHVEVIRGPKENGHRPAIDPLFRSAAEHFGPRVTGVVLSGALDDGAAGLRRIRQAGGVGIVQDPRDAMYDSMPKAAIAYAEPDDVLDSAKLGDAVTRFAKRTTEGKALSAASANPGSNGDEAGAEPGEDPRSGLR
jgi:two-component system, chemotaxis family, protein-glutamate methylesterase/glutaminase